MKYILSLLLFFSLAVKGQDTTKYTPMAAKGYKFNGATFKNIWIGQDTTNYKTGIVRLGFRFFVGNGVYWKEIAGGSSAPSGLSGAVVTQIDSTRFNVSPGSYYIQGSLYANGDTTFNLDTPGDTSRIDVIGLDTTGNVFTITGVESENPYPSSIDPLSQIYLSFVWVDTDTVYFAPTPVNYWSALGNDIINNNAGKVRFTNGLYFDRITASDSRIFSGASQLVLQSNRSTGVKAYVGTTGGNTSLNTTEFQIRGGDNSTTGTDKTTLNLTARSIHSSGTEGMNMLSITPSLIQSGTYMGIVRGIYYNPTVTANLGTHYAFESTLGRIKFGGMETGDTTTYKPLGIDASGNLRQLDSWPAGAGGGVGTLQQVTDLGNQTTNGADFGGVVSAAGFNGFDDAITFTNDSNSPIFDMIGMTTVRHATFDFGALSTPRAFTFPDQDATIATIQDIADTAAAIRADFPSGGGGITIAQLTDSLNIIRDSLQVLRDSLAAYRAEDTVYTTSGIETVYSDDSTTIRLPYKSWVALISQTGTDAPTAIVLQNDFDETFTLTYGDVGEYRINSANNNFTTDKTFIVTQNTNDGAAIYHFSTTYVSDTKILMNSFDSGIALSDSLLNKSSIEIRVFY